MQKLWTVIFWAVMFLLCGGLWGAILSTMGAERHQASFTAWGAITVLLLFGVPYGILFLWDGRRPRHRAPIKRSRSRYFNIKEG